MYVRCSLSVPLSKVGQLSVKAGSVIASVTLASRNPPEALLEKLGANCCVCLLFLWVHVFHVPFASAGCVFCWMCVCCVCLLYCFYLQNSTSLRATRSVFYIFCCLQMLFVTVVSLCSESAQTPLFHGSALQVPPFAAVLLSRHNTSPQELHTKTCLRIFGCLAGQSLAVTNVSLHDVFRTSLSTHPRFVLSPQV